MSKKICVFCIIFLSLNFLLLAIGMPGKIVEIDGEIQIQRKGTTKWIDGKINMLVYQGDKIKSLLASAAIIKLPDESEITIAENSVVTFSTLTKKKKINLKLNFGGVRANVFKVGKLGQMKFNIKTPTAVAGVRGTDFEVAEGFEGSNFMVIDGIVEVAAKGKKIVLKKQEKVKVDKQGTIGKKTKAKEGETLIKVSKKIKKKIEQRKKKLIEKVKKEKKAEKQIKSDTKAVAPDTAAVTDTKVVEKADTAAVTDTKVVEKVDTAEGADTKVIEKVDTDVVKEQVAVDTGEKVIEEKIEEETGIVKKADTSVIEQKVTEDVTEETSSVEVKESPAEIEAVDTGAKTVIEEKGTKEDGKAAETVDEDVEEKIVEEESAAPSEIEEAGQAEEEPDVPSVTEEEVEDRGKEQVKEETDVQSAKDDEVIVEEKSDIPTGTEEEEIAAEEPEAQAETKEEVQVEQATEVEEPITEEFAVEPEIVEEEPEIVIEEVIMAPQTPMISEPMDNQTIYTSKIDITGSSEDNVYVVLKVNNSQVAKVMVRGSDYNFSNVSLNDGSNKISVYAFKEEKGQELKSDESSVTVNVISSVSPPKITSPGPGSNINRGAAPVITLISSDFLEWTNRNPLEVSGTISYNNQLTLPDMTGEWKTTSGIGIEGEISLTLNVGTESYEYTTRSDASGVFTLSGTTINLSDENFITKVSNDEVSSPGGNFQYSWILEQGNNKLDINANEKSVNILIKVKGSAGELESKEAAYSYTSSGKSASMQKTQKLDSLAPEATVDELVIDNVITIRTRDPEPTSGVYRVEAQGISFKRTEGSEQDSSQIWEGNLNVVAPELPPYPPKKSRERKYDITVRVVDKAENETTRTYSVIIGW